MLIGELSRMSGLSRDTIRFYEKQGLITVPRRERRFNNYKEYSAEILQRLQAIKQIKSYGFTLHEVQEVLCMTDEQQATCSNIAGKIEEKVKLMDDKIRELITIRGMLLDGLKKCRTTTCNPLNPNDNCRIVTGE